MKACIFLILLVFVFTFDLFSYEMQQVSITFIDEDRDNRPVSTEIFFPVNGEEDFSDNSSFPFIVFGHGWISPYSLYQDLWEALVPQGWIMAFPTTEGGLFPNHQNFALDLAFLSFELSAANNDPGSPLFGMVDSLSVVMGHSMGGGCSILAAAGQHNFSSVVTLAAAASTNPPAIDAAAGVYLPSLTFAGTSDSITPPASNQLPLYNNLASVYKGYVSMNGVGHLGIYSNVQVFTLISKWLDFILHGESYHLNGFEDLLIAYQNEELLTYMIENNYTSLSDEQGLEPEPLFIRNYPNPFNPETTFLFLLNEPSEVVLTIFNSKGQKIAVLADGLFLPGRHRITWHPEAKSSGIYLYRMQAGNSVSTGRALLLK
jgi:hypothetical protein